MIQKYLLNNYARFPLSFSKGENATLYDHNGEDYIDFGSGIGVVSVGHGNFELAETISEQAFELIHTSNLYAIEPQELLAKKIVEMSDYDMAVFFGNSGAEANEGAIKIARKYGSKIKSGDGSFNRYKIITLHGSFHGRTMGSLKATGQPSMHLDYFGPYPDGFVYASSIDEIPELLDEKTVAVMIELIQGEGGIEVLEKNKVQELAKLLKQKNILLIVDEVQTGVFRTGEFLASNLYEIEPDIITLAKGLAGGVPIGAVMTSLKDIFEPSDHGSTFGGNFLATRASLKVLDILNRERNKNLIETVDYFDKKIENLALNYSSIFEKSVGLGLMRGLRVNESQDLTKIIEVANKYKVLVIKAGKNTMRFLPPLTISKNEIDEGFKRLENALKTI
jgi:acetylornithine aminotransferase